MIIKYLMKFKVEKNPKKELTIGLKIIATPEEEDIVIFKNRK